MLPLVRHAAYEVKLISDSHIEIGFQGQWTLDVIPPEWDAFYRENSQYFQKQPTIQEMSFSFDSLEKWDTILIIFLINCELFCQKMNISLQLNTIPPIILKIVNLFKGDIEGQKIDKETHESHYKLLDKLGLKVLGFKQEALDHFELLGNFFYACIRLIKGKAMMRMQDLCLYIEECGARSLPIVSLIAFLVGVIMAFVGSIQLRQFGADIYVANLVSIAMVREMGAMMSAIILAGKIGAAYAAKIGTMKVSEEIDALKTMGVSPIDYLVLPKISALFFMMPLLCIYANFVGIFGGYVVSMSILDVTSSQYINQTKDAITGLNFSVGVIKSFFFGFIIAFVGCLRGLKCSSNSSAVGLAATEAVVFSITYIVIADALFTFMFDVLGI